MSASGGPYIIPRPAARPPTPERLAGALQDDPSAKIRHPAGYPLHQDWSTSRQLHAMVASQKTDGSCPYYWRWPGRQFSAIRQPRHHIVLSRLVVREGLPIRWVANPWSAAAFSVTLACCG